MVPPAGPEEGVPRLGAAALRPSQPTSSVPSVPAFPASPLRGKVFIWAPFYNNINNMKDWRMAQQLATALPEDLSSIPSVHVYVEEGAESPVNSSSRHLTPF